MEAVVPTRGSAPPTPVLSPGQRPPSRREAEEIQELLRTELDRVRKSSESWRTGLAALLTLITTVSIVKGRDTIVKLSSGSQKAIGILLLPALIAGSWGAFRAMRAAF